MASNEYYIQKVIDGYRNDVERANESLLASESSPDSEPAELGGVTYSSPIGSGGISLPTGDRGAYQKKAMEVAVSSGYSGFQRVSKDLFDFTNGQSQNLFNPLFATKLTEFAMVVLPRLGKKKMVITSGLRTPEHNDKVHGAKYSPHMGGIAVDISAYGQDRYIIADAAYHFGFGGIAVGGTFVHIDIGARAFWPYDPVPKYTGPK